MIDTFNMAQSTFHVAQYEGERKPLLHGQLKAVQAEHLRLGNWLLLWGPCWPWCWSR